MPWCAAIVSERNGPAALNSVGVPSFKSKVRRNDNTN